MKDKTKEKKIKIQENKNKTKKVNKKEKNNTNLKKKTKVIIIICVLIIIIELIIMFFMKEARESKLTFIDTLYSIQNVDDDYYIAAGSSNFRYSNYNNMFSYEYEDTLLKQKVTTYAEQAKLVKYDKEFNIVFEKTFKTKYDSTFYDVAKVKDGYLAVGSYIYEEKQINLKTRDGLIAKYDLFGNLLWHKNYQVLGDTEFKEILIENDGFVVVGQSIYENMEIGNHPTGGGIIVKYDFDGNVIWYNNFGGNKSGIFESLVKVEDGYIVCGKDASNYGLLVKFDLEGNKIWHKNYANTDTIGMSDIKLKDDKLYIASSYNSSEEVDAEGNLIYNYDACIFVYDLNGELLDKFTIGGDDLDRFNSILLLDNSIIAIGYTNSKDIKLKELNYQETMAEGMIVKFNYEGKILDNCTYGGKKNETLNDIIKTIPDVSDKINKTNSYIIVGFTNSKRSLFKGNNKDYYAKILKYNDKLELLEEK